jgi:hypothetical protein
MDHHQRSVNKFTAEDKFFSAIGRFFFEFSQLEQELKYHVAGWAGLTEQYQDSIMTHDFSMLCTIAESVLIQPDNEANLPTGPEWVKDADSPARQAIRNEYKVKKLEQTKKLQSLINQCKQLGIDRNAIAHGLCCPSQGGGQVHHISRSLKTHLHDADDIASMADRACHLRDEIPRVLLCFLPGGL